jgi:hypothetical protein
MSDLMRAQFYREGVCLMVKGGMAPGLMRLYRVLYYIRPWELGLK